MNGILVVNKPKDITSRNVVNSLCKIFNTKKIGHTGTLDPLATGVLVVCIGKYTKLVELITSEDKEYIASFQIGYQTDTYDKSGKVINESTKKVTKEDIIKVISKFPNEYDQEVPIYSAVKINGKKLYQYARANENVNLPKRKVLIKKLELLDVQKDIVTIKAKVSKGTYIRSLINDIGLKLNTYATMLSLERTKQGSFSILDSYSLDDIKNNEYQFISLEEVFKNMEIRTISDEVLKKVQNGAIIDKDFKDLVLFKDSENHYIAIYKEYSKDLSKAKPYIIF